MSIRRVVAALALVAGALPLTAAGTAGADVIHRLYVYPSADCPGTLQDCVANADVDAVIDITDGTHVNENVIISKTLTIIGTTGNVPEIDGDLVVNDAAGSVTVTLADLHVVGTVAGSFSTAGAANQLTVQDVDIDTNGSGAPALSVGATVQTFVTMTNSRLHGDPADNNALVYVDNAGTSTLVIATLTGNVLEGVRPSLSGHGGEGVYFATEHAAAGSLYLYDNVIRHLGQAAAGTAAVHAVFHDDSGSGLDVRGNTIQSATGAGIHAEGLSATLGARVLAFDNIITGTGGAPIALTSASTAPLRYSGGYNDLYNDAARPHLAGLGPDVGDVNLAPKFVDASAGNLNLKSTSPLIDRGLACTPSRVSLEDLAGHDRVAGRGVDIGAYEYAAGPPTGAVVGGTADADNPLQGTSGSDVICGYGGSDYLYGLDGNDYLYGGGGADHLDGGRGVDVVHGDTGSDIATGGAANDRVYGDGGGDQVIGGSGADHLYGGPGNDPCIQSRDGVNGNDHDSGGPGTDKAYADSGDAKSSIEGTCHPA